MLRVVPIRTKTGAKHDVGQYDHSQQGVLAEPLEIQTLTRRYFLAIDNVHNTVNGKHGRYFNRVTRNRKQPLRKFAQSRSDELHIVSGGCAECGVRPADIKADPAGDEQKTEREHKAQDVVEQRTARYMEYYGCADRQKDCCTGVPKGKTSLSFKLVQKNQIGREYFDDKCNASDEAVRQSLREHYYRLSLR